MRHTYSISMRKVGWEMDTAVRCEVVLVLDLVCGSEQVLEGARAHV
jgi:hypothetical protein